jgi:predicted DNA-binding transcriptional regulator YafY
MQKFKPQYRRLLCIDRKLRERAFPNCVSLAAEWEVSDKTIQRDIDYLRDEHKAPIAYDALKHGYFYTEANYSLPAISISESDLFSIYIGQTILGQFRNTPLFRKLNSVFDKVKASLPEKTGVNPAWLTERILVFPEPATTVNSDIWEVIAKAIRENRSLSIRHATARPGSETAGERKVDPYYLVSYKGEWYLSSYCHYRKAIRTFAVSRITHASVLDTTFCIPAGMTKAKMFGDQFGIIWKDKFYKVRIRFTPEVAPYIRERQWHSSQKVKDLRGGGLILEFTTNHLNEVKDWVLSWGPGATVLAPAALVAKVKEGLKGALGNY